MGKAGVVGGRCVVAGYKARVVVAETEQMSNVGSHKQ